MTVDGLSNRLKGLQALVHRTRLHDYVEFKAKRVMQPICRGRRFQVVR
ncbi:hypothetical protein BIWAKO_03477 [Bosea sp. BIWAKO-01]|nr:hypothetical protein BIWAKO_03477 [Bosea sp. BIWAKO-01]